MPRLGYLSADEEEFLEPARRADGPGARLAWRSSARCSSSSPRQNLYPYTKFYLRGVRERFGQYWNNHFSTIGLVGMNEACVTSWAATSAPRRGSSSPCASSTSCGRSSSPSRRRRATTTTSRPRRPRAPRTAWRGSTRRSSPASSRQRAATPSRRQALLHELLAAARAVLRRHLRGARSAGRAADQVHRRHGAAPVRRRGDHRPRERRRARAA